MLVIALIIVLKPPYKHANAQTPIKKQTEVSTVKAEPVAVQPTPQSQPQPAVQPETVPEVVPTPPVGVQNCGDNIYKQYIYQHESGCRTDAVNSIGCAGLGQKCPGGSLPCSLSDWVCQDNYFSNYAIQRYGSWANAYAFWLANHWW